MGSHATRQRILSQGLALASRAGLEGVTLGVLAGNTGMSKSGLFAHFKSKEAIQISLLDHSAALAQATVIEPAMKAKAGLPRLHALVTLWFGWTKRAGLPGGCPVAAGMFEYDDMKGPVREKIVGFEAKWRTLLASLVREAISEGHFRRDLDVNQFVWELCGIYLSLHVAARFLRSSDSKRRARVAFDGLLKRAASEEKGSKLQCERS